MLVSWEERKEGRKRGRGEREARRERGGGGGKGESEKECKIKDPRFYIIGNHIPSNNIPHDIFSSLPLPLPPPTNFSTSSCKHRQKPVHR